VGSEEEEINRQPVVQVELASLSWGDSPRLSGEDPEHVETLAAVRTPLPPIIVQRATMRVIDGVHRVRAAMLRGEDKIGARFFDGPDVDALVLAVRMNVDHGLPLALADRKRAAERFFASHPQWSDRKVASITGISPGAVAEIRKRIVGPAQRTGSRIGQDGRVRPLDGSAGRLLAGRLMTENPCLSLRQVARAAAISPETARDVRNRLRNGEDPIPGQRRKRVEEPVQPDLGRRAYPGEQVITRLPVRPRRKPRLDRATVVNQLKDDPALRYSERGRNLLRLLTLHVQWTEEWEAIVSNVPPHCAGVMADLARQFADLWTDFATRADRDISRVG
jgi:hypothetical protein